MRYAWDLYGEHIRRVNPFLRPFAVLALHHLRIWYVDSSGRVDHFIANSKYVAGRIRMVYGREAKVIYPPVDVEKFEVGKKKEDY